MSLVLDSSATLAWIYSDETTDAIRALFDQVADEGAVVPALWRLEIANSLTVAVRRSRIDVEFRRAALADLAHRWDQVPLSLTILWLNSNKGTKSLTGP